MNPCQVTHPLYLVGLWNTIDSAPSDLSRVIGVVIINVECPVYLSKINEQVNADKQYFALSFTYFLVHVLYC